MTDSAALTDEELAEMEFTYGTGLYPDVERLIVALYAEREESEGLRVMIRNMRAAINDKDAQIIRVLENRVYPVEAALRASRARVRELEDGIEAFLSGKNPL